VERAADDYRRALEIAERQRTLNPTVLPVIGWFLFRLG
jgi:hypothetical protein